MANRTVVVASTASSKARKYSTSAKTWGELKSVISELLVGDLEAIVNPGHVTLTQDNAVLPTGDFKLYLIPTKNKAGAISIEAAKALGKEIAESIVEAATKAQAEDINQLKENLRAEIEDFFNVELGDADCEECAETLREAKNLSSGR